MTTDMSIRGLRLATEKFLQNYASILLNSSKRIPMELEKKMSVTGRLPPPTRSPLVMIMNGGYSTDPMITRGYRLLRHLTDTFVDSAIAFSAPNNHRLVDASDISTNNNHNTTASDGGEKFEQLKLVSALYGDSNQVTENFSAQSNLDAIKQLQFKQAQLENKKQLQIGASSWVMAAATARLWAQMAVCPLPSLMYRVTTNWKIW